MSGIARWMIAVGILAPPMATLRATEPAGEISKTPAEIARLDSQRLDGVWLVESAVGNGRSSLALAWNSKITIDAGGFSVSRFSGSSSSLKGTFTLDAASSEKTVDLNVDEIDLSELWEGVKYPKCLLRGIYRLDNDSLIICFRTGSGSKRPSQFVSGDKTTVVLSLVRADPRFKDFPKEVTVSVSDQAGKPVAGASLFQYMALWHNPKKQGAKPDWEFSEIAKTGPDGSARVPYDEFAYHPAAARDAEHKLTGFASISPASSQKGPVKIVVRPERPVRGTIVCDDLTRAGKPIGFTNAYLLYGGQRIGMCDLTPGEFEFHVPPGSYTLDVYGEKLRGKRIDINVPDSETEFPISPIALDASRLPWLEGRPAPELEGVLAWRGSPVKLADLKGKYVLLDFWGYWCGPCVGAMPVLLNLHERFKNKGLAIIGVHVDLDGEVDTPAKLDEKIAPIKQKIWEGRDLPFPVALTNKDDADDPSAASRSTAAQFGILSYPTTILIDREGKVVGQFNARDEKEAVAEIEKLLGTAK